MSQAIGNARLAYIRLWHHTDASGRTLGKLAVRIANVLMGKHKPTWHPSLDYGDYVVVTNARKLVVSGKKADQLVYRHHSMFPGGLHERKFKNLMKDRPEEILRLAVSGMLPKNTLRDRRMERLKIFEGPEIGGGLGGNITTSWGGSLLEQRGLIDSADATAATDATLNQKDQSGGDTDAGGVGGVLMDVDWTKPLPGRIRSAKEIRGKGDLGA